LENLIMQVIGLIGGMSWESTLEYYRIINQLVRDRLGGQHSAKILMYSVDFHEIEECQQQDRWDDAAEILIDAAQRLEKGKADLLILCTNTMHKLAENIQSSVDIPLIHIADATAEELKKFGISVVGLLGTRYTMEQDFLRGHLASQHDIKTIIPPSEAREIVHRVIYDELCLGRIEEDSRDKLLHIISDLEEQGARGVILGCTELPLLIRSEDVAIPVFDTTAIHARKAVDIAICQ
jgi:aspartate racemase